MPMYRRSIFAWCAALLWRLRAETPQDEPLPVLIEIGAGKAVTVTLRGMEKAQLAEIIADLLTSREKTQNPKLQSVLEKVEIVTLVLTTGRERVTPKPQ